MTKKDIIVFNEIEEAVFLGNLLGDGHIQKRKNSYRSKIQHSHVQLNYVEWKYTQLERFALNKPQFVKSKFGFEADLFYLRSGEYLKKYHEYFYQSYIWVDQNEMSISKEKIRYKKKITVDLINELPKNPYLLAVWFMDDGSKRSDCYAGRLATQCFSKDEQKLLQDYLFSSFSIKTSIVLHKALTSSYYLSIPGKNNNFSNFVDIIKPIVDQVPCMKYKIYNPRND